MLQFIVKLENPRTGYFSKKLAASLKLDETKPTFRQSQNFYEQF